MKGLNLFYHELIKPDDEEAEDTETRFKTELKIFRDFVQSNHGLIDDP